MSIQAILDGAITPLQNEDILMEYREVLSRPKFPFSAAQVESIICAFRDFGLDTQRAEVTHVHFPDPDDIVFYEVKMSVDEAFPVTGDIRHFPATPFVVTPTEMVEILKKAGLI